MFDNTLYISTVPGNTKSFYKGNGAGVLWALDADTGKERWKFWTVPEDLWSAEHKEINSGGGLWHPPAFDDDGDVYIDVANPAPWPGTDALPWGSSRPGPNPHTNTLVKLNPDDGTIIWEQQVLAHDVYDWDLQLPPVLVDDGDRTLALAAGKVGYVYAMDRRAARSCGSAPSASTTGTTRTTSSRSRATTTRCRSCRSRFSRESSAEWRPSWRSEGGVVYAPIVNIPTVFNTQTKLDLQIAKGTGEMVALNVADGTVKWKHDFAQPAYGAATISNDLVFTTTFDGKVTALDRDTGSVVWEKQLPAGTNATIAIVGDTLITAASFPQTKDQRPMIIAYRLGATGSATTTGGRERATTSTGGSADGKNVFTSNCGGCHVLGAAGTTGTVGPNLDELKPDEATVEQQVRNGGGGMPAFQGRLSDAEIMAVAKYVAENAGKGGSGGGGGGGP